MFDTDSGERLRRVRQYDSSGRQTTPAQLQENGFDIGVHVMRKKSKAVGVIKDMTSTKVQVEMDEPKELQWFDAAVFLRGEWRTVKPKADISLVENWDQYESHHAREMALLELQAEATSALVMAVRESKSMVDKIDLVAKPTRDVVASKPLPKHQLSLVPATTKVLVLPKDKSAPAGSISMGQRSLAHGEDVETWLAPHMALPKDGVMPKGCSMISPCWLVRGAEKAKEVNMEFWPNLTGVKVPKSKDFKVPVLRNTVKINQGVSLLLFRPKATDSDEEPPMKKARK